VLVVFSLFFYAWGEPVYVFLMLLSVAVNFAVGLAIDRQANSGSRRWLLWIGVAFNLLVLCVFKYLGFLAYQLLSLGLPVPQPHIALPIGISFYTFQSISYLVDVHRREAPVQRRYRDLLLYISMFPQLIAGPIVRYGSVAYEIGHRHVTSADLAEGIYRFVIGLGKKVIIANQLSEVASQLLSVEALPQLSMASAWVGIIAFTLQIYFDFSGYSDMAIGIGRCLGFHFRENFNHPYCCTTITDFWRRWHISLGSFFRDYVYIPLGGNRRHQALNILVVWFLTGLWHGASWNFVFWGLYFGLIVMLEKYTVLRVQRWIPSPLLHLYSLLLVVAGWGIFYFDDIAQMRLFFLTFLGQGTGPLNDMMVETALFSHFWLWVGAMLLCLPLRRWVEMAAERWLSDYTLLYSGTRLVFRSLLSLVLLAASVALLVGATSNPFLYTRF
jgi:alginate O-acetyltransferase complex protein AlgI